MNQTPNNKDGVRSNKEKRITELEEKRKEYLDGWQRAQADLVNYKKDESRRMEELVKFANEVILVELISFMDEFDIALSHLPEKVRDENKEWASGLNNITKKFGQFLEKMGVKKIKTVGEEFNPLMHESVGQGTRPRPNGAGESRPEGDPADRSDDGHEGAPDSNQGQEGKDLGSDKVVEEVQAGYEMHGKVIRPAKVRIAS